MTPTDSPNLTLAHLRRRQRGRIAAVTGEDDLAQRLCDQGLWPGVEVELVTTAPGGDPLLFVLDGYRLALRRDEALRVLLSAAEPT